MAGYILFRGHLAKYIYVYIYLRRRSRISRGSSADLSRRRNNLETVSVPLAIMSSQGEALHTLAFAISNSKETKRESKLDITRESKLQIETANLISCDN